MFEAIANFGFMCFGVLMAIKFALFALFIVGGIVAVLLEGIRSMTGR